MIVSPNQNIGFQHIPSLHPYITCYCQMTKKTLFVQNSKEELIINILRLRTSDAHYQANLFYLLRWSPLALALIRPTPPLSRTKEFCFESLRLAPCRRKLFIGDSVSRFGVPALAPEECVSAAGSDAAGAATMSLAALDWTLAIQVAVSLARSKMASWWMQKWREERTASTDCWTPAHSGEEGLSRR